MASSVSLSWARAHVVCLGRGRYLLCGVPLSLSRAACTRLLQLGVTRARVVEAGVVGFRCPAGHPALLAVVGAFPTCPLVPSSFGVVAA
jgi:hypothetical protein